MNQRNGKPGKRNVQRLLEKLMPKNEKLRKKLIVNLQDIIYLI